MHANTLFLLLSILVLFNLVHSQKFNAFKSYKDAKVKPRHYGKGDQRTHPIEEYLTDNQMKMMRARKGGDTEDNSFDNNWSGFATFQKLRKPGISKAKKIAKQLTTDDESSSSNTNWRRLDSTASSTSFYTQYEEYLAGVCAVIMFVLLYVYKTMSYSHNKEESLCLEVINVKKSKEVEATA